MIVSFEVPYELEVDLEYVPKHMYGKIMTRLIREAIYSVRQQTVVDSPPTVQTVRQVEQSYANVVQTGEESNTDDLQSSKRSIKKAPRLVVNTKDGANDMGGLLDLLK